jgi:hypothetical protein
MRRLLVLMVLALATVQLQAQHMKFMGVEMGGDVSKFVSALKQKGLKKKDMAAIDNVTLLEGKFAGYSDCTIMIYESNNNKVYLTAVMFDNDYTWSSVRMKYTNLKNMLITKYGQPAISNEEFDGYEPSDDYLKMAKARNGGCRYNSRFDVDGGLILLNIQNSNDNVFVSLTYGDEQTYTEQKGDAIDDL